MNYEFFLLKISTLPKALLEDLRELASNAVLDPRTSYFVPGYHPGMTSGAFPIALATEPLPKPIDSLLYHLNPVMPRRAAMSYLVNRLDGGGFIREHTDATGGAKSTGRTIPVQHLLHVSLTGDAVYEYRRDRRMPNEEFRMENGCVYAYNNYVYHGVRNEGADPRFNIILYYQDDNWHIKRKMYEDFNVPFSGY